MSDLSFLNQAGHWLVYSGIQEPGGGVSRYYLADARRNLPVSTEITGYAVSAFVYLHSLTHDSAYLDRAIAAARFLTRTAWRADLDAIPFETSPTAEGLLGYFFDNGIIVRGLLAAWRATGDDEFLTAARAVGRSMARDFHHAPGQYHPILVLPGRIPLPLDQRWSRSIACYQLKSAMAWHDLDEALGGGEFTPYYDAVFDFSLRTYPTFLPGLADRRKVMDRLHAFCYFLEGMLPSAAQPRVAAALAGGIALTACYLRDIASEFARSDVYAQLLRTRLYADWAGAVPLDLPAAEFEAARLAEFQHSNPDPRIHGGFCFGRAGDTWLPYVNPVSTVFALQALTLWYQSRAGGAQAHRHLLI